MYANADVTLYLYSKEERNEKYTRIPVRDVFWDDVRQSTFLKTGQKDAVSVLLVIPLESLEEPLSFTKGKDLAVRGIVEDEIDCRSQEAMSKALEALRRSGECVTITSVDGKLFGSREVQHYELTCK